MPSPFPGMDPFIESQAWGDFHTEFITGIRAVLAPQVVPRYTVRVEERVYVEYGTAEPSGVIQPDLVLLERERGEATASGGGTATAVAPALLTLAMPQAEQRREVYLTVRLRETMDVVTVIELLSPWNKRPGSDGRREYLEKRDTVLRSPAHLLELDLLRGGHRLPTVEPLPPGDYYAFVTRRQHRPQVEVYAWSLRRPMPAIGVPLSGEDPAVVLDLQAAFSATYDRALYVYSLSYREAVEPPLRKTDVVWVQKTLAGSERP